jgi:RNA polymerase sigma-70 factor (ECF subfamily)
MRAAEGLLGIYDGLRPRLHRLLAARTGDPALAEDLLQDLWMRLQAGGIGPVAHPEAYLCRMAMNLATDHARSRMQSTLREEKWAESVTDVEDGIARDSLPDAERILMARDELQRVLQALEDMPPRAAQIFRLHRIDGESHNTIAARLGISRSAVEKSMAVALKHLFLRLSG